MARLDVDRQKELEPKRLKYAIDKITAKGYDINYQDSNCLKFNHKGSTITFYPYSGWHTGKTIKDGRGIEKLLAQI